MKNKDALPKFNLFLHSMSLILAVCCAILNEEPAVRIIWSIGVIVWIILIIIDIRNIIKGKKDTEQKTNL